MRNAIGIAAILALLPVSAGSSPARVWHPPQTVGPPDLLLGPCPVQVTMPGGKRSGAEIPIPALRLGAPVERNATSFATGGGATANATERWRRQQAGLQADPRTFDVAASAKPSVFAVEPSQVPTPWIYQRLPIEAADTAYGKDGMIFAQATSPGSGRIASLALTLPAKPAATPRLTIAGGRPTREGCKRDNPIDVYAPAMTAAQLRRLFSPSACRWNALGDCTRDERPRGRVLFVQKQQGDAGYEYRWVDYDLLAATGSKRH